MPIEVGEFPHTLWVEAGQVRFKVERLGTGEVILDQTQPMAGLDPSALSEVQYIVNAATGDDAWIDNLVLEACP